MSNIEFKAIVNKKSKEKACDTQWESIKDVFKKWRESTPTP